MSTVIKKDKHRTININIVLLVIIAHLSTVLTSSALPGGAKEKWVIVIDAGHGGKDPGAVGSYSHEKNITLAIALKTGAYLEQNISNAKVIYTRKKDVFIGLNERSEIANANKADLFISIHANANPARTVYGSETYVMGHSMDKQNLEVAMKENEVILLEENYSTKYEGFDPKSPESYIMFTLMQNAFSEQSRDLAARIQSEYKTRVGRHDRGVKQDGFWVLWRTTMPGVLTEVGFISNANEERYLNSAQGQDYIASALYRACRDYIADIDRKSGISPVVTEIVKHDAVAEAVVEQAPAEKEVTAADNIIFMVQVAASTRRQSVQSDNFRNIKDIKEIPDGNRYRYATGAFKEYDDAVACRKQIESVYPDAFVIAIKGNKILPLQEAIKKK